MTAQTVLFISVLVVSFCFGGLLGLGIVAGIYAVLAFLVIALEREV